MDEQYRRSGHTFLPLFTWQAGGRWYSEVRVRRKEPLREGMQDALLSPLQGLRETAEALFRRVSRCQLGLGFRK